MIKDELGILTRYTCWGLVKGDPVSPLLFKLAHMNKVGQILDVLFCQYKDDFVLNSCIDSHSAEYPLYIQQIYTKAKLIFKMLSTI